MLHRERILSACKDTPMERGKMPATTKDDLNAYLATAAGQKFATTHYTVAEVAALWKLSDDTIRRMFQEEPEVLVIEIPNKNPRFSRRRYRTLRIPEFVVERVYRRQAKP
jgi:hypothetical protein